MFYVQYVHMSNLIQPIDITSVIVETKQPACHLVPAAVPGLVEEARDVPLPLRTIGRPDTLTSQRVEVGIVLNAMLGTSAATEYLSKHAIADAVMQRVLSPTGRRRGSHDASGIQM